MEHTRTFSAVHDFWNCVISARASTVTGAGLVATGACVRVLPLPLVLHVALSYACSLRSDAIMLYAHASNRFRHVVSSVMLRIGSMVRSETLYRWGPPVVGGDPRLRRCNLCGSHGHRWRLSRCAEASCGETNADETLQDATPRGADAKHDLPRRESFLSNLDIILLSSAAHPSLLRC
jgi:hypothetical protein